MASNSKHDEILRAIGQALSNWSAVELQLSALFNMISDIRDTDKAAALFSAIIAFDARLAVVDRLMSMEKADAIEMEMWARMSARLSKFYKKRHELAHFSVDHDAAENPVISPFLSLDKIFNQTRRHLTVVEISERSAKFIELHMTIHWFMNRAYARRASSKEGRERPLKETPLVPRLRELASQILEERKRPPKPSPA
jgi:hypothetical protein